MPDTVIPANQDGHVFISYSRMNIDVVRRLANDLSERGINVWIDARGLKPGMPDYEQALRDAIRAARAVLFIASPDAQRSLNVRGELRYVAAYKGIQWEWLIPIWVDGTEWIDSVPLNMVDTQRIDARDDAYAQAVDLIVDRLKGGTLPPASDLETTTRIPIPSTVELSNPYKGLEAFQSEDADYFYGRQNFIPKLIQRFDDAISNRENPQRILAVIGASGSGKSSVVMAGLMPKLRSGGLPGSQEYVYLTRMVPGKYPIKTLAEIIAEGFDFPRESVVRRLNDIFGLYDIIQTAGSGNKRQPVVLFIDQFEELFIQTLDEQERQLFIEMLVHAVTQRDSRLMVVLTMRADFYDRPLQYERLGQLIADNNVPILPMSLEELRSVIEEPARKLSVKFEDNLVGEILLDVQNEVGALPLLQFTLQQLFQRDGRQRKLKYETYVNLGRVQGALEKWAEQTYMNLPTDEYRDIARWLFLRMIAPGNDEQSTTRRRATEQDLDIVDTRRKKMIDEVSRAFVDARLLVSDDYADSQGRKIATLEVAHEALIRQWGRLTEWVNAARQQVRFQNEIARRAENWERYERSGGWLQGLELQIARDALKTVTFGRVEEEFIRASIKREEEEAARLERLAQDLEKAKADADSAIDNAQKAANQAKENEQRAQTASEQAQRNRRNARRAGVIAALIGIAALAIGIVSAGQVGDAQTRVNEANQFVITAQTQVAVVGETLTPIGITLIAAQAQVTGVAPTVDAANTQVAAVGPTLAFANAQLAAVQPTLDAANRDLSEARDQATLAAATLTPIGATLAFAETQVAGVEPALAFANTQVAGVQPTLDVANTSVAAIQPTLQAANLVQTEARRQVVDAGLTLTPIPQTLTPIGGTLAFANTQVAAIQPTVDAANTQVAGVGPTLAFANAQVTGVQPTVDAANLALTEARVQVIEAGLTLTPIPATLAFAETQVSGIQPTVAAAETQVAQVQPTVDAANIALTEARAQVAQAGLTLTPIPATLNFANTQVAGVQPTVNAAQTQVAGVQPTVDAAQTQVAVVQPTVAAAETQVAQVQPTVDAANNALDEARKQVAQAGMTLTPIPATLAFAETRVAAVAPTVEAANTRVAGVEPTVNAANTQVAGVQPTVDAAETQVAGVQPTLNAAETQVAGAAPTLTQVAQNIQEQSNVADAFRLAVAGEQLVSAGNPDLALALILEAYKLNTSLPQTQRIINDTIPLTARFRFDNTVSSAFSADGRYVFESTSTSVRMWEIETRQMIREYVGGNGIRHIVLSPPTPEGHHIIAGLGDNLYIWDSRFPNVERTINIRTNQKVIAFSPTQPYLVVGSRRNAYIYDYTTGTRLRQMREHESDVAYVTFNENGQQVYSMDFDDQNPQVHTFTFGQNTEFTQRPQKFRGVNPDTRDILPANLYAYRGGDGSGYFEIWNPVNLVKLRDFRLHNTLSEYVVSAAFSRDRLRLLAHIEGRNYRDQARTEFSVTDRYLALWNIDDGSEVVRLQDNQDDAENWVITSSAISDDGLYAITGGRYGRIWTVTLWDLSNGAILRRWTGHTTTITDVAFSPNGQYAYSLASDSVRVWDVGDADSDAFKNLDPAVNSITGVGFSADGAELYLGFNETSLGTWVTETGAQKPDSRIFTAAQNVLAFSPVEPLALVTTTDGVVLWNLNTLERVYRIEALDGQAARIQAATFSADGRIAVVSTTGGRVYIIDIKTGNVETPLMASSSNTLSVNGNGEFLVVSNTRDVALYDLVQRQSVRTFDVSSYTITNAIVSSDARYVAAAAAEPDNAVLLWEAEIGRLLFVMQGHIATVHSLAFSPDGRTLASGADDATMILWDTSTGQAIRTYRGHTAPVIEIDFGPEGRIAVTRSENVEDNLLFWRVETVQGTVDWVYSNRVVEGLSCAQRTQYRVNPPCVDGKTPVPTPTFTAVATPTVTPTFTPRPTFTPTMTPLPQGTIIGDGQVRLRSGAGSGFRIIGFVNPRTVVTILQAQEEIGWLEIRLPDGTVGWVSANLVSRR